MPAISLNISVETFLKQLKAAGLGTLPGTAAEILHDDVRAVMRDLKAIGAHNAAADRPPALSGKQWLAGVERNYERFRRDGKLPATFEVIYGHAWRPAPRLGPGGKPVIDIKPVGGA